MTLKPLTGEMDNVEHLIIMQCSRQWGWCSLLCVKKYLGVVQGTKCTNHWPDLQTSQTPTWPSSHEIWPHISQRPLETLWTCCQYPGARHHRTPPEVLYPCPGRSDSRFIISFLMVWLIGVYSWLLLNPHPGTTTKQADECWYVKSCWGR